MVVITFSGHGTYVPDLNGDEVDGLDEALCPYDMQTSGAALIDDEIHALFAARKPGVRLVLISDSCHSGTVTRAAGADPDADDVPRPRFMPMGNWLPADKLPRGASGKPLSSVAVTSGASPFANALSRGEGDLLLSGCKEGPNNFSYDAQDQGPPERRLYLLRAEGTEDAARRATYADWHAAINPDVSAIGELPAKPADRRQRRGRKQKIFA